MSGTDHVQGTVKFLPHINPGISDICRLAYQPEFQTRIIQFGQIKFKKDPYKVLNIVSDTVNYLIE